MTELSIQWACQPQTGDYGQLGIENLASLMLFLGGQYNARDCGIVWWRDSSYIPQVKTTAGTIGNTAQNLLEPVHVAATQLVRVFSGVAVVNGWLYVNDGTITFDVSGGNANATDLIVLQWTKATQQVRLVHKRGPIGGSATLTQNEASQWEIPIAEVTLDGAGNFSSLLDVRKLAVSPTTDRILIDEIDLPSLGATAPSLTLGNIPCVLFKNLYLECKLATNIVGLGSAAYLEMELFGNAAIAIPPLSEVFHTELDATGPTITAAYTAATVNGTGVVGIMSVGGPGVGYGNMTNIKLHNVDQIIPVQDTMSVSFDSQTHNVLGVIKRITGGLTYGTPAAGTPQILDQIVLTPTTYPGRATTPLFDITDTIAINGYCRLWGEAGEYIS